MAEIIEVKDLSIPELELYASRSEVKLYRYYEPLPGLFAAESCKVIRRALDAGYEPVSFLFEKNVFEKEGKTLAADYPQARIYVADETVMKEITGYKLTGGALSLMKRRKLPSLFEIIAGKRKIAVLEDVENPANVGAIIRSAAALGMEAVILTKSCADPLYRRSARVSMGNVFLVPWTMAEDSAQILSALHKEGFYCLAMALREDSVSPADEIIRRQEKTAVFLGAEGEGLTEEIIESCDRTVMIPMYHGVDSLNVAAASAVVFWENCRKQG